jgi:hypothetical protein
MDIDINGNLVVAGTNISVSYDATNHALSFTGTDSYANYAKVAEGVILSGSNGTIDAGQRDMTVTVFDEHGASGSVQTHAVVGDTVTSTGITLSGDALGHVVWSADGNATLGGGTGDDLLVMRVGDPALSINGGGGLDQLLMQNSAGHAGDWLMTIQDDHTLAAISQSGHDPNFIIHLDQNSTIDLAHTQGHQAVFSGDSAGSIDISIDPTHTQHLDFAHLDKIVT